MSSRKWPDPDKEYFQRAATKKIRPIHYFLAGLIVVPLFGFFISFLGMALPILALMVPWEIVKKGRAKFRKEGISAPGLVLVFIWSSIMVAACLSFGRFTCHVAHWITGDLFHIGLVKILYGGNSNMAKMIQLSSWIDLLAGICAILVFTLGPFIESLRMFFLARQVRNLPTSKAHSAAIGIAEFEGTVAALDRRERDPLRPVITLTNGALDKSEPFYLEDKSGRILVDATPAKAKGIQLMPIFWQHKVILKKKKLLPGDPIYLIGSVQRYTGAPMNASDSDALIVQPLVESKEPNPFWKLAFGRWKPDPSRDIQHMFFITDKPEEGAVGQIYRALLSLWMIALVWIFIGSFLVVTQFPRTHGGPQHWTSAEKQLYNEGVKIKKWKEKNNWDYWRKK